MIDKSMEWLRQADYDLNTAEFMFNGERYFYAVFMSHLSIEKALKGLYQKKLQEVPPKVHNLIYLLNKIAINPPDDIRRFLIRLNEASVMTRYPDDLEKVQKEYTQPIVNDILSNSREALRWIKAQF